MLTDDITTWCTFCQAAPAVGNLKKVIDGIEPPQFITLPSCDECARMVLQDPARAETPHDQWVDSQPGLW